MARVDAVIIGVGAGLSTSAGFVYTGERFDRYFKDFSEKYHFSDMYSAQYFLLDVENFGHLICYTDREIRKRSIR